MPGKLRVYLYPQKTGISVQKLKSIEIRNPFFVRSICTETRTFRPIEVEPSCRGGRGVTVAVAVAVAVAVTVAVAVAMAVQAKTIKIQDQTVEFGDIGETKHKTHKRKTIYLMGWVRARVRE